MTDKNISLLDKRFMVDAGQVWQDKARIGDKWLVKSIHNGIVSCRFDAFAPHNRDTDFFIEDFIEWMRLI